MGDGKRILILTVDAGYGHRSAAYALAEAFGELYPANADIYIYNPHSDQRVPKFLRKSQNNYDHIVQANPRLHKISYEISDLAISGTVYETFFELLTLDPIRDILDNFRPDVVITTYMLYQAPVAAARIQLGFHPPLLTVVTDFSLVHRLWFHKAARYCLVPTEEVRTQAIDCGLDPKKVLITGIPVNPVLSRPPANRGALRRSLGWETGRFTTLIVGSKRVRGVEAVLAEINRRRLPIQLAVVTGGDDALYGELLAWEWSMPTRLYPYVEDLAPMLQAADCVLTKAGGLIVAETLACGLPLVLIDALPGQETGNMEIVVDEGAGELVNSPKAAADLLKAWSNDSAACKHYSENALRLGRPQSAYEIARLAWNLPANPDQ